MIFLKSNFEKITEIFKNENENKIINSAEKFFQIIPPYEDLIDKLINTIDKDSYICTSLETFNKLSQYLPENISQLDLPKNYLSVNRLKSFQKKEFFENYEIIALIKLIIWSQKTETGHLHEIKLFQKENLIIPSICADQNLTNIETEPFIKKAIKKDQNNAAICTHQFFIESHEEFKNTLFIDFEKFIKTLFSNSSAYLDIEKLLGPIQKMQKIHPESEILKKVESKITILFGIIGMIFQKYNDRNAYKPRCIVTDQEIQTKEWQEITDSLSNIIKLSFELVKLLDENTEKHLKNWKYNLKILDMIFKHPDLNNYLIFIEEDQYQRVIIKKIPKSISKHLHEVLQKTSNYKVVGENLILADDGDFFKALHAFDKDLEILDLSRKRENLIISIIDDAPISENEIRKNIPEILKDLLIKKQGNVAIIINSLSQLKFFTIELKSLLSSQKINLVSKLTGSISKVATQFKKDPDNSVILLTPNAWQNIEKHKIYKYVNTLIVLKLPFDPPSDAYIVATSEKFKDPFSQLQIPRVNFNLRKIINRLPFEKKNEVILFDSRILNKNYGKSILKNLNQICETSKIKMSNL